MEIKLHSGFELNGTSFKNTQELLRFSESVSNSIHTFLKQFFDEADSVKLQTSGSTGTPKTIEIKKKSMVNSALATGSFFDLGKGTTVLLCMNPEFIAGKMMLVRALILGWKLDVVAPSLNPFKDVKKKYDFSAIVPLQVANSLDDLHKVKKLIIGGGVISKELENQLQELSTEFFATYGMTETVSHIAVRRITNYELRNTNYKVLPKINISKDNRNCLVINAPLITESEIVTNDLVEIISDSEFKWLGRYDNIINSGGIKLIPEQIEGKLSKIIDQRFFVAGIPDELLGEKLVLLVEIQSDKGSKEQRGKVKKRKIVISNAVRNLKTLDKYETPKEIYFIDKFVETATKKIQREKTLNIFTKNFN
ncbi:MAG: AMP-binding protein [Urechidicola sp.]|nr:AMP-binding protein [Urechidicola sp.]